MGDGRAFGLGFCGGCVSSTPRMRMCVSALSRQLFLSLIAHYTCNVAMETNNNSPSVDRSSSLPHRAHISLDGGPAVPIT